MGDSQITLTRQQSRLVDQIAIDQFGMMGLVLLENAGRGCADRLIELGINGPVVICCGRGNNGGDGFVMARHLDASGFPARLLLWCDPQKLQGDAAANYQIIRRTRVPVTVFEDDFADDDLIAQLTGADWIVDALLGTGSRGEPRPPLDRVIRIANAHAARKLAIDIPSGLDCDTGEPSQNTFRADHTFTFVAAKTGMVLPSAQPFVRRLRILGIGTPPGVLDAVLDSKRLDQKQLRG